MGYQMQFEFYIFILNERIGCVMVSVIACSVVDCGFEPRSGQTKDYKIGICCFSAMHAALRRKSKDWLGKLTVKIYFLFPLIVKHTTVSHFYLFLNPVHIKMRMRVILFNTNSAIYSAISWREQVNFQ
jgi:hypothetical protein